jgi:hypothetical protein
MLESARSRSIVARVVFAACLGASAVLFLLVARRWYVDPLPIAEYRAFIMHWAPVVPAIAIIVGLCVPARVMLSEPTRRRRLLFAAAIGTSAAAITFVVCCVVAEALLLAAGSASGRQEGLESPFALLGAMLGVFMVFITVGGLLFAIPAIPFGALAGVACLLILQAGGRRSAAPDGSQPGDRAPVLRNGIAPAERAQFAAHHGVALSHTTAQAIVPSARSASIIARIAFAACLGTSAALFLHFADRGYAGPLPFEEYREYIAECAQFMPLFAVIIGVYLPMQRLLQQSSLRGWLLHAVALGIGGALLTFVLCCLTMAVVLMVGPEWRGHGTGSPIEMLAATIGLFMALIVVGGPPFAIPAVPFGALAGVACLLILQAGGRLRPASQRG